MKYATKQMISLLCAVTMILTMLVTLEIGVQAAEGLDLTDMQIVLPDRNTAVENTAASELKKYIFQMTGESLMVVKEGQNSGAGIYIGATEFAEENGVTYPVETQDCGEAWAIQVVNGNLVLCGGENRGVLYAVYHLLEDGLGVRWWNLWEEYVPLGSAIVSADYCDSGIPAMEYREIFIGKETVKDYPFYACNRMNGSHTNIPQSYGGEEAYAAPGHTHTFNRYFPAVFGDGGAWLSAISDGGDFSTNPQWYALVDGQRRADGQLCLTNEGLKKEFAQRLIHNIGFCYDEADAAGKERPCYFAIVPNDTDESTYCQCDGCQSAIREYGYSGYILSFINELADAVIKAGYRDAILEMAAYRNYVEPPKGGIVPAGNVQIRFCDDQADLLHGLNHENNAESMKNLQAWADICDNNLYYWQYVVNYNLNGVFPSMFSYGENMTKLAEMGVDGWFAEQEQCINVDFWDMKLWLIAKLMEKPVAGEEYAALMDEFIYGYYGEAAGTHIRDYLYYMHEKAEATDAHQWFGTHIIGAEWLDVKDILAGNEYFEKAFAAADKDPVLLRRLHRARSGLDCVIVENFSKWEDQSEKAGLQIPFTKREVGERVYQTMAEQVELRGQYDIDYPMFFYRYDQYADDRAPLPGCLGDIVPEHILEYTADDFRLAYDYQVVWDPKAPTGKAVRCKAQTRVAAGDKSLILWGINGIDIALYDPEATGMDQHVRIGTITADDITAEGYQLYKFDWTVPAISNSAYIYIVGDWGVQNPVIGLELRAFAGQTVEFYLSMKAEGTLNGSDPGDYPVYHFERMLILPKEMPQQHDYVSSPIAGKENRKVCTICGDAREDIFGWDEEAPPETASQESNGVALWIAAGVVADMVAIAVAVVLLKKKKPENRE